LVGNRFRLFDDDYESVQQNGGFSIELKQPPERPDTSSMKPALADAYILPVINANTSSLVEFDRNINEAVEVENVTTADRQLSRSDVSERFWGSYLLGAFQGIHSSDDDPRTEGDLFGERLRGGHF
jgi:hypothetical protein